MTASGTAIDDARVRTAIAEASYSVAAAVQALHVREHSHIEASEAGAVVIASRTETSRNSLTRDENQH